MKRIRKAFSRPLFVHTLGTYPTLPAAVGYVDMLLRHSPYTRFNIQQTHQGCTVGRVAS